MKRSVKEQEEFVFHKRSVYEEAPRVQKRPVFGHLITAVVTPFTGDGKVDTAACEKILAHIEQLGTDGIVVAGTTGEGPTLSFDEKVELFKFYRANAKKKTVVIANTGGNDTASSVKLGLAAEKAGVDGLMVVMPYYNKPNAQGQLAHFTALANAARLPMMLYNIPGRTGAPIQTTVVAELSQIDNIVAIKEASGNLETVTETLARSRPGFLVYSGDDTLTLPILSVGGVGVVSVASHVCGDKLKEMIDAHFAGQVEEAKRINLRYFGLMKTMFITTNPIPIKSALHLMGLCGNAFRLPMTPLDAAEMERLSAVLRSYGYLKDPAFRV